MIYTVTLNPAIDHIVEMDDKLKIDITNYYQNEYIVIGGKGINVSILLNNLSEPTIATGIMGEDNKNIFLEKFSEIKLKNNFIYNKGNTRVNYKIKNLKEKSETELNGVGLIVQEDKIKLLMDYLNENCKPDDVVILTGSVPRGIGEDIYLKLGELINKKKSKLIIDASGVYLKNSLKAKPFLIKPNTEEICKTLGIEFEKDISLSNLTKMVDELKKLGAQNVLVSQGSQGSLYFSNDNKIFKVGIAKGKLVNSVGSGDSMIAGFTYGLINRKSITETLQIASACGGATAFTKWLACKEDIEKLINEISVEEI